MVMKIRVTVLASARRHCRVRTMTYFDTEFSAALLTVVVGFLAKQIFQALTTKT